MNKKIRFKSILVAISLMAVAGAARSEDSLTIIKNGGPGTEPPIWVSISGFTGEAAEVLRFDLYVQGFNFTNAANAQYLISGSNSGNLQAHVMDRYNKSELLSKAYSGASLRRQAHAFVDDFVEMLGRKGIARTKIAFKVDSGVGRDMHSEIYVADFDGHNFQPVTKDNTLSTAPCWVPGRFALFYGSFKLGNPGIFSHDLTSGARKTIAWYGGARHRSGGPAGRRQGGMVSEKGGGKGLVGAGAGGDKLLAPDKRAEGKTLTSLLPEAG